MRLLSLRRRILGQRPPAPGFFDGYPRFFETSQTTPFPNRLNKRFRAIFETIPGLVSGARVLDIASHDGRWSLAALKSGAKHVVGVEPRKHLVAHAKETLQGYGCAPSTFEFIQDDIFNYLKAPGEQFDVVLCLGFLYHTYRHPELFALIKQRSPKYVVVDTGIFRSPRMACSVTRDDVSREQAAASDETGHQGQVYVGVPSRALLEDMATHFGFDFQYADWRAILKADRNTDGVEDYARGKRVTMVCRAVDRPR
jgi:predicted nicotinamide N-methyase